MLENPWKRPYVGQEWTCTGQEDVVSVYSDPEGRKRLTGRRSSQTTAHTSSIAEQLMASLSARVNAHIAGRCNRWVESGVESRVDWGVESGLESVVGNDVWSRGWSRGWNRGRNQMRNRGPSPNRAFLVLRFDLGSGFPKHGKILSRFLCINKIARPQPQHEHVATRLGVENRVGSRVVSPAPRRRILSVLATWLSSLKPPPCCLGHASALN